MEVNAGNIQTLALYLQQTLSTDIQKRKPAEKFLESIEVNQNYPVLLLQLLEKQDYDITVRVAGAIAFKNYIKRNWKVNEDCDDRIHPSDREKIKSLIVSLMLQSPDAIQKQLSDAITIIGREDFPAKWPGLMQELVEKLKSGDFHIINGVLHTAHSIFKRYRYEFKSQELWTEIKFSLDMFAKPLTDLFQAMVELANQHADNPDALKVIFSILVMSAKIFYSLNFQDLPEFFEDNMATWMKHFLALLNADNKLLKTEDEAEAGLLEQLKSQVCDNVTLYAQRYDEEFGPYLPGFVTAIWNLLVTTGQQPKYDLLVSNALQFLATVADRPHYNNLFKDPAVLGSICEKVVIPNMEFRTADEELFEDNPEEYIRRDIEGSDVDTRRRAACDLVKALSQYFETQMMEIFGQYVQVMLQKYAENPMQNWRSKDAALYLVTSLAAKGQTARQGITKISELVNIPQFHQEHILPELEKADVNSLPVLKADAIKYVMIFRTQLPREIVLSSIPLLVKHLQAQQNVVHTYSAVAIEKILVMRGPDGLAMVKSAELAPVAGPLLKNLFEAMSHPGSQENEYIMKAIMRSFSALQENVVPFLGELLPKLTSKLALVARNPSKPHFNHFLFETLSLSIRIVCKSNTAAVSSFEEAFFPIFQELLQQDVQEFIPYVFQILSLLLELHDTGVPEPYMGLFPCLLMPVLWERPGNIHPLVRLLQAYVSKGASQIVAADKLNGLLGVFQKLIASKTHDHEGFYLLQAIVENFPSDVVSQYMKPVFLLLFQRLSSSKTTKFVKGLLVFFFLYVVKCGGQSLIEVIDSIQQKMFGMVVERIIVPDVQKIEGATEKKIAAVGMTKLLCETPAFVEGEYAQFWGVLLKTLISLFELPTDETIPDDEHFVEVDETPGYEVAYSKLAFAGRPDHDPLQGNIPNTKMHLVQSLHKLSLSYPGKLQPLIASGLPPLEQKYLEKYLQEAQLNLL